MKTKLLITFLYCFSTAISFAEPPEAHIQAIRKIGQILAEYTSVKGATPYLESWKNDDPDDDSVPVTIICNLSENKIPDKLAYPPFSCYVMEPKELEEYLSEALGRKIVLPRDDRKLKLKGRLMPLFYTIQISEGRFFVATYLTEKHKNARKLADNWYKFEVGSVAIPKKKIEKAIAPTRN